MNGGLRSEQPTCAHDKRPELAPVVASGPVAFVRYASNEALKYAASVRLSRVVMPGITSNLQIFVSNSILLATFQLTQEGHKHDPASSLQRSHFPRGP